MAFPPVSGQTSYPFLMDVAASAGQIYDIGFNNVLSPVSAVEPIPVGLGVAKVIGQDMQVRLPHRDIAAVTASTALSAGNITTVTLNGITLGTTVTYATSNAATLLAIAALIEAQDGVASAVSNGTDTITVTATQGLPITLVLSTSGGSAVTWTTAYTNDNVFYGVALYIQNKMNILGVNGSGAALPYQIGDPVPAMTRGRVWVVPEDDVTSDDPVYWRITPTLSFPQVGGFRSDSDGGNAILLPSNQIRWLIGASAGGYAVLDINQP